MNKFLNCIFLFFSITTLFSQNNLEVKASLEALKSDNLTLGGGVWLPAKSIDNTIVGSQYLFDNWNGMFKVITKDGSINKLFNLNYNLKSKTLESSISKDSVFQYNIDNLDYVINLNKKYKFLKNDKFENLCLEVYSSEKIKFYQEYNIEIEESMLNPLTQVKINQDKYIKTFNYYVFFENDYHKIKLSKSEVLKYLNDKKDSIKVFVSENKLSYSNVDDLQKILIYYNSL